MKNHVLRPLWVAIALVVAILVARAIVVPKDFGVHAHRADGKNFTYGFYRAGDVNFWKDYKVKYKGRDYCNECHDEKVSSILASKHRHIQCENCHGPAIDHPDNPEKLKVDRRRELCLRCHAALPYPNNPRSAIPGIDPDKHNPGDMCADCHNPHNPNLEDM